MFDNYFLFMVNFLLSFSYPIFAKVHFLTFHYNKPEYIELQHTTFKEFMLDDYELIVFNDARNSEHEKAVTGCIT